MAIVLQPETEKLLEDRVRLGGYSSIDDVVHAAIGALDELEPLSLDDATLDAIDEAEKQIICGETHDWNEVRESVRRKFVGG